ncbi:ABC transporter ATP-binding protein [Salisediminibacterium beveridgei]|uniref:ABC transporter, ATP-binding protein n=1 Tax=Salisediminibacterium beveridgei TaxID=632773 RepID=A0A1D7QYH0_9BACI|nr:ABC transporter ATP-binding protein [Salisediminibacterium beveridgei]AOM84042.1 ABC transporter, ATP-binding protein [Salisediminibacterium beveridgei]
MTVATKKEVLVKMNRLGKVYPNGTVAVRNVNMDIPEGEFICFVGPSGCGKSTVFKMITGLEEATEGEIEIFGKSPANARKENEVAFVFQDHTLLPWRKVKDNVALPLELKGVSKEKRYEEVDRVLELVGLAHTKDMLQRELSGGMKMRVSIARALVTRPKLLLMDEPFGALDEITRQSLQQELLKIWQQDPKMTVLFITHNVFEAVYLSSKLAVMTPGPGKVSSILDIDAGYPRGDQFRSSQEFGQLVGKVSGILNH